MKRLQEFKQMVQGLVLDDTEASDLNSFFFSWALYLQDKTDAKPASKPEQLPPEQSTSDRPPVKIEETKFY